MTTIEKRLVRIEFQIGEILRLLALNFHFQGKIMSALSDLQAAVAAEDTVIDSAVTLINGIPALIAAAGTDPTALAQLQADITAKSAALAAAVAANTPAAPAPAATLAAPPAAT